MKIATWNLERPKASQREKLDGLRARMLAVEADIWILTETNSCVSPGPDYRCVASTPISGPERYWPGENRTTIWSRFPIEKAIETHDHETAVCAEIKHGDSLILVYGTIIPYHAAGTKYPYRFEGKVVSGRKGWELHYESIGNHAADWWRLRKKFQNHSMCVAGDLNQNRDGRRWYGTKAGREELGLALSGADMTCVTESEIQSKAGEVLNPVIDHICLDRKLAERVSSVQGWAPGRTAAGRRLSDHIGLCVDLAPTC